MRLGDGLAQALSPDGRWAIVQTDGSPHFDVIPTGPGEALRLERPGLRLFQARWLPDGQNVVVTTSPQNGPARWYVLNIKGSAVTPVTPDGFTGDAEWAVSPDGSLLAITGMHGFIAPVPLGGDLGPVSSPQHRR